MSKSKSLYLQNCEIRKELGKDLKFFELEKNDIWKDERFHTTLKKYTANEKKIYVNRMRLNQTNFDNEAFLSNYELMEEINAVLIAGGGIEIQKPLVDVEIFRFRRKKDCKIFYLVNCHRLVQVKVFDNIYKDNYFGAYYTSYFANENCKEVEKILDVICYSSNDVIKGEFELFDTNNCCYIYDTLNWSSPIIKMARFYPKSSDLLFEKDMQILCVKMCKEEIEKRFIREYKNIHIYPLCDFNYECDSVEDLSVEKTYGQRIQFNILNTEDKFYLKNLNNIFNFADYDDNMALSSNKLNVTIRLELRKTTFALSSVLSPKIKSCIYIPSKVVIEIKPEKDMTISRMFDFSNEQKFCFLNSILHAMLTDETFIENE